MSQCGSYIAVEKKSIEGVTDSSSPEGNADERTSNGPVGYLVLGAIVVAFMPRRG
jgi:hypothetical protein